MSMTFNLTMAGSLGCWIGIPIGWYFGSRPPDASDIRDYMDRIVNIEAMEEHEKLVKLRMARNAVRTTRVDGGPNARVTKMRVNKVGRRTGNKRI